MHRFLRLTHSLIIVVICLVATACRPSQVSPGQDAQTPDIIRVPPPEVDPFIGKRFLLDTMPPPQTQRVAAPIEMLRNTPSLHLEPRQLTAAETTPKVVTPGKGNVSCPREFHVPPREVAAVPSALQPLLRPGVKPLATHDVRYWNMEHGLNTYFVHDIYEDHKGYLWLASRDDGLARFDGNNLLAYDLTALQTTGGGVRHIQGDQNDVLWLSMPQELVRFDGTTFRHYDQAPLANHGLVSTVIDSSGTLWGVLLGGGLLRYDGDDNFSQFGMKSGVPGANLSEVIVDATGDLWFVASGVLVRYDGTHFYHYPFVVSDNIYFPAKLASGLEGDFWVWTEQGLLHHDGQAFTLWEFPAHAQYPDLIQLSVAPDDGTLWAISPEGLASFADGTLTWYPQAGFSSSAAEALFAAKEGQVWLGTHGGGLNKLAVNSFTYTFPQVKGQDLSIAKSTVSATGDIFLGTRGHGLFQLNDETLLHYPPPSGYENDGIVNMTTTPDECVWLGYNWDNAVTRWDGSSRTRITSEQGLVVGFCTDLITDRRGRVWGAFAAGLSIIDGNTITTLDTSQDQRWFLTTGLELGADDDVWASTSKGLALFRGDSIYWYESTEELPCAFRYHLEYVPAQGLMMPELDGLGLLSSTAYRSYGKPEGLETVEVNDMETDPWGTVWADTKFGLFRVDITNQHIEPYHLADGLRTEKSSPKGLSIGKDSVLWLANGTGVGALDLRKLEFEESSIAPRVHLSALAVNETQLWISGDSLIQLNGEVPLVDLRFTEVDRAAGLPRGLSAPATANHFTFNFVAFDWSAPHKVQYRYRLEGQDEDWGPAQVTTKVDYRGLQHGHYVFMAQAKTGGSAWGEPLRFSFTIRPPWWLSLGAKLIYALAAAGLLFIAYSLIRRRFQLRNAYAQEQAETLRLRELDEFKSRFYTNITHEFRTPLTVVLGMARQLQDSPGKASQNSRLIEQNGERMLRLINQLLDLSKLESNTLTLQTIQGDILPFIKHLTNAFQSYADDKCLVLRFTTTEENLVMDYDAEKLQQIATNLISNAIKFTPEDGEVTVTVERHAAEMCLRVTDTGIGIPLSEQTYVFNRFYQVDGSHTRKGEGTGIGLAHTRALVQMMEGRVELASTPGVGSVFTVYLPISNEANLDGDHTVIDPVFGEKTKEESTTTLAALPDVQQKQQPLVLVIEDNVDVVTYLRSCLEPAYRVEVALNGKIGVNTARDLIPDLIVSDVMMPEMDGFGVCNELKQDEKTSHIPIILLTAKADVASRLKGLARGADAYLAKPFVPKELTVRLAALLKRQQRMATYFSSNPVSREHLAEAAEPETIRIEQVFLDKLTVIVAARFQDENFNLPELCEEVSMSRSQLFRKLKAIAGVSPSGFIRNYRLEEGRKLLLDEGLTIAEIAYAIGFKEPAHFTRVFRDAYGMPPSAYRAQVKE